MHTYRCQYRREQRVNFDVEADTQAEAKIVAEEQVETFDLDAKDDSSDDPGELEVELEE